MISHLVAVRQAAFGAGLCHFASAAKWTVAVPSIGSERSVPAYTELAQVAALAAVKSEAGTHQPLELGSCNVHKGSACDWSSAQTATSTLPMTACTHRPTSASTGLTAWRLLPCSMSSSWSSVMAWPAAIGSSCRCLHSSMAVSGAAAVSAAAAAATAAAEAAATGRKAAATSSRRPLGRRQQPLSAHAYEFQRRFFQLVNSGSAAALASTSDGAGNSDSAADAVAHNTNSQAIRMLLAWLEEGRMTAAAEHQEAIAAAAAAAASEGPAAAAAAPPAALAPGAIAAPYRLDQQIIDRAMDVLWRLHHREGLLEERNSGPAATAAGDGSAGSAAAGGPMGLAELLNAAAVLAAAAPAMGLTFKRQHYDLLIELYGRRALQEPSSRRGLGQRLLAVRQQMVQQLMPLNQAVLNTVLQAVRTDPLVSTPTKLTWAIRLVERDLPVVPAAGGAASTSSSAPTPFSSSASSSRGPSRLDASIIPSLQKTLTYMLRTAAREADWSAYGKLEAALVCRTRAPPPYEVLLEALNAASAAGGSGSRLAWGFLAQMEQLEAKERERETQTGARGQPQQRAAGRQQQRWEEFEAERRLDQELRSLRQLLHVGVEQGDEQLAKKSYDRLRRLFWREHPAVAIATAEAAKAAKAKVAAASRAKAKDSGETAEGAEAAEGALRGEEEQEDAAAATPVAATPATLPAYATVLEAAEICPAPPGATLELMSLALARRDWAGVMDNVVALAELQSLLRRSRGLVGRLLLEDTGTMEGLTSAYGGLGAISETLIGSEADTVSYYTELLSRIGAAAATGAAAPFAGSSVPFGPPLRAAAARADLASVAAIVRQMRELHCGPGADSYAAVVEASLRGEKPERIPGLIELMLEEGLVPTASLWEVQLRAATEAGDVAALTAVSERALSLEDEERRARQGVANISEEVLTAAGALAEVRADSRASSAIKLLRLRGEELRDQHAERRRRLMEERAAAQRNRRMAEVEALRRNAASLSQPSPAPSLPSQQQQPRWRSQGEGLRGQYQQQRQQESL